MKTLECSQPMAEKNHELGTWFAQAGPTESFLRSAPQTLHQENQEANSAITPDPSCFATVGPTPGFVYCR